MTSDMDRLMLLRPGWGEISSPGARLGRPWDEIARIGKLPAARWASAERWSQ